MLELSIYEGIPHMLLPVVTESKKAASALRWAVREMEDRYTLMAKFGVRNLEGYNKKVAKLNQLSKEKLDEEMVKMGIKEIIDAKSGGKIHPMPFIVIIIDELADLLMVSSKDTEMLITRLAQMARASGIHLVLATQRPSTDVITGLIKANFPARISFQVASKYDSRTILDGVGAESLLGAGDMLFLPPASSKLERLHGAFISDQEINETVDFLKKQRALPTKPIDLTPVESSNGGAETSEDEFDGDLYSKAVEIVVESGKASISMIQRRMRIGYNRAARLIEKMEVEGIVGPSDGVKGREVLIGQSAREN
jgi:S-DNA-T family DNA segregation ATPase FtsK/SpoIIIE